MSAPAAIPRAEAVTLVTAAVRAVLAQSERPVPPDLGEATGLYGGASLLDSLGLVTLVIEVEQRVRERFGVSVTLADEAALSLARSPFRTVGALSDYVVAKAGGAAR